MVVQYNLLSVDIKAFKANENTYVTIQKGKYPYERCIILLPIDLTHQSCFSTLRLPALCLVDLQRISLQCYVQKRGKRHLLISK